MPGKSPSRSRAGRLVVLGGAGRAAGSSGVVWLVGAGPGDPELLTLKALRLLQSAEVVVHDRLTPQPILDLAGPKARLIDVASASPAIPCRRRTSTPFWSASPATG